MYVFEYYAHLNINATVARELFRGYSRVACNAGSVSAWAHQPRGTRARVRYATETDRGRGHIRGQEATRPVPLRPTQPLLWQPLLLVSPLARAGPRRVAATKLLLQRPLGNLPVPAAPAGMLCLAVTGVPLGRQPLPSLAPTSGVRNATCRFAAGVKPQENTAGVPAGAPATTRGRLGDHQSAR